MNYYILKVAKFNKAWNGRDIAFTEVSTENVLVRARSASEAIGSAMDIYLSTETQSQVKVIEGCSPFTGGESILALQIFKGELKPLNQYEERAEVSMG